MVQLQGQPTRTQLAYFYSCLTPEMRSKLAHAIRIGEDDNSLSVNNVLNHMTEHFQRQRNVALRGIKFEEQRQEVTESFNKF